VKRIASVFIGDGIYGSYRWTKEKLKNSHPHVPHVPQVQSKPPGALSEVEGSAVEPHHQERIKKGRTNPADTKIRSNW
jgi:hypothetical protein